MSKLKTNTIESVDGLSPVSINGNVKIVDFGTVFNNNRYVLDNPFGNENYVGTEVQLEVNGKWAKVSGFTNTDGATKFAGVVSGFIEGEGIVVQTSEDEVVQNQPDRNPSVSIPSVNLTSAPCRVIVFKIGDATDA